MRVEEVIAQYDALLKEQKNEEAEKLLKESEERAMTEGDDGSRLMLLNELMGYMRETSQVEASYRYAGEALRLMEQMQIEGSTAYATTLLNIANAYRAGGRLEDSMQLYEQALSLYGSLLQENDMLFASLYNNISLLYQEMENFEKAGENLLKALEIVKVNDNTAFEEAVTYANLAAVCLRLDRDEEAFTYCKKGLALFDELQVKDSHYCAVLSALGTYHYKKKDYQEAAAYFERAMEGMKASLGENAYYHRLAENLKACRQAMGEKGLQLCREYYETYGKPMLHTQFAEYEEKIAVGLCGEGSDCFGWDDVLSQDHDWGPGFCMWVSDEIYSAVGERLKQAYDELPKEFKGYKRADGPRIRERRGVHTVSGFYERLLGKGNIKNLTVDIQDTDINWSDIPDEALAAATNGEVFVDGEGSFSAVRTLLQKGFPGRIVYLKIAEAAARFSQGAQYNFPRMVSRGDEVAAALSLAAGLKSGMKLLYYLDGDYPPHDKWLYRGICEKTDKKEEAALFSKLLGWQDKAVGQGRLKGEEEFLKQKEESVEKLAGLLADRLYEKDLVSSREPYLDAHTAELLQKAVFADKTKEELAEEIARTEFKAFDKVQNKGGRASCQNNWPTFSIMRKSQYLTWDKKMLMQYLYDFRIAYAAGRNMIEEKYGRMMESTAPEEYEDIKAYFPPLSPEKQEIIEAIVGIQVGCMEEFASIYPRLADNARHIHTYEDGPSDTSYETYLRGELSTYSDKMLELYGRFIAKLCREGKNIAALTMENSVHFYGYATLEEAEEKYLN
ncbi:MAG: DUF4125 family protein [Lachnospiraceae bacterium]|nr:DUF4125 family protein [Lachnospiraceae bacterium]